MGGAFHRIAICEKHMLNSIQTTPCRAKLRPLFLNWFAFCLCLCRLPLYSISLGMPLCLANLHTLAHPCQFGTSSTKLGKLHRSSICDVVGTVGVVSIVGILKIGGLQYDEQYDEHPPICTNRTSGMAESNAGELGTAQSCPH